MSRIDEHSFFRSLVQLRTEVTPRLLREVERSLKAADPTQSGEFEGKGRGLVLEAHVRQHIIDPMLAALGWRLDDPESMMVEAGVEPPKTGGNRRFLDYLGVARSDQCRASLLVEAKRLSQSLPAHEEGADLEEVMIAALKWTVAPSPSSAPEKHGLVSEEWIGFLTTLLDYVGRLHASQHGAPRRVLMTNGEWLVVFINPKKTLVDKAFAAEDLLVVSDLEYAGENAVELFSHLSFEAFIGGLPDQNAVDICRFFEANASPVPAAFAADISTGMLDTWPLMGVRPMVAVQTTGGGWLRFRNPAVTPRVLAEDDETLSHMSAVNQSAEGLLGELMAQCNLRLVDATTFEATIPVEPPFPSNRLVRRATDNKFVIYLGKETQPFVDPGPFTGCPYHFHGPALRKGEAAAPSPVLSRSTNPPAYFTSGSPRHCAHGRVHVLREKICAIRPIDEYLCCRACAFQGRCWPDGGAKLPCVKQEPDDDVMESLS